MNSVAVALGFLGVVSGSIFFTDETPLLGRSLVANFDPTNATSIARAKVAFPSLIDDLFESGALNTTDTSLSVDVFSAATNKSFYTYTHVGENERDSLTAGRFDDDTISRVGSVSKLFTVYALIHKMGIEVLDKPVTDFLPELAPVNASHSVNRIRFENLTVGALASQQAGTGGATGLLLSHPDDPAAITDQDLFDAMLNSTKHPVVAPYEKAMYSDGGFLLLTQIVERVSGLNYTDAIQDIFGTPLGLKGTSAEAPTGDDLNAIDRKPIDDLSSWGEPLPIAAGSGGVYTNRRDLRRLGLSILNSELLSAAVTRRWMKPLSHTGSLVESVGAPWEIARLAIPIRQDSNKTRISDLYTKAGGAGDYTAILALSPDHGIGFSILVAGSPLWTDSGRFILRSAAAETFLPAAEWAAVENAERNIVGTFTAKNSRATNITLSLDQGTGLVVDSVYVDGEDARWRLAGRLAPQPVEGILRLYPTDTNSRSTSLASLYRPGFTGLVSHRMVVPRAGGLRSAVEGGKGGMMDTNFPWMNIGFWGTSDELMLQFDGGRVVAVHGLGMMWER